jgi:hypothetical protein
MVGGRIFLWIYNSRSRLRMKFIISFLVFLGVLGVFSGLTGIQRISYTDLAGWKIDYHYFLGRVFSLLLGFIFLITAYGCKKRKQYSWYIIAGMAILTLAFSIYRAVYLAITIDLPLAGLLLGGVGELIKIGLFVWFFWGFWIRKRKKLGFDF